MVVEKGVNKSYGVLYIILTYNTSFNLIVLFLRVLSIHAVVSNCREQIPDERNSFTQLWATKFISGNFTQGSTSLCSKAYLFFYEVTEAR